MAGKRREMKTRALTIVMEPTVYERLRLEAFNQRCSVGEIVRRAMAAYLAAKREGR